MAGLGSRGEPAHLADLLGKQQQLGKADAVPGQVISEAAQRHVLHDKLHRLLACCGEAPRGQTGGLRHSPHPEGLFLR